MLKRTLLASLLGAALGLVATPRAWAQADTSDTQRVGNIQFGNSLDPSGWFPFTRPDPQGMSWLHAYPLRTPTGVLYPYPYQIPEYEQDADSDWQQLWLLQFGYMHVGGDGDAALFRSHADWNDGPVLGLLALSAINPRSGAFVEFRGSRISSRDQYYRLRAGHHGKGRIEFFHRDTLHVLSTTAHPLWDGVGTSQLTLPAGLATGSTQAQVRAVQATRPQRILSIHRSSTGISWERMMSRHWIGYAGVDFKRRKGKRDWGGPMYLSYFFVAPGPGGVGTPSLPGKFGGQYETVRPIDFSTTRVHLGLRNKGGSAGWLFDFSLEGSFFRNHKKRLDFEVPFAVSPGYTTIANGGTWSLEPDNDYYHLRMEASHALKLWHGVVAISAGYTSMRQNDALQAPLNPAFCPSGQLLGPKGIPCSNWNTTAALSRPTAEARIDSSLLDLRVNFRPSHKLGVSMHVRQHHENNMTHYTMYNPLTGQYGYVPENGSLPVLIGLPVLFEPGDPVRQSVFTQIANTPFSYDSLKVELGGSYRFGLHSTLGLRYWLDRRTQSPRERSRVNDQHLKLTWDGRVFNRATLRLSYEHAHRSGSTYHPNPYLDAYSPSMPGYVLPAVGYTAFTVAQMYKYDLSDRSSDKFKAILTLPLGYSATLSASLYGHRDDYAATIGRQSFDTGGGDLSWDWAPSPATSMNVYAGYQSSRLRQGSVNDHEALTFSSPDQSDMRFGGPFYPLINFWTASDHERNAYAGAHFRHAFSPRIQLDLDYNLTYSHGVNRYGYASPTAISTVYSKILDTAAIGNRFPSNLYRLHELTANLRLTLSANVGLRLFCKYQHGNFADWHNAGFNTVSDLVIGNRVYTDLGPQPRWHAAVAGVFLTLRL